MLLHPPVASLLCLSASSSSYRSWEEKGRWLIPYRKYRGVDSNRKNIELYSYDWQCQHPLVVPWKLFGLTPCPDHVCTDFEHEQYMSVCLLQRNWVKIKKQYEVMRHWQVSIVKSKLRFLDQMYWLAISTSHECNCRVKSHLVILISGLLKSCSSCSLNIKIPK